MLGELGKLTDSLSGMLKTEEGKGRRRSGGHRQAWGRAGSVSR
jgi:hypothetical protein